MASKQQKEKLKKLLNLLSFKLNHKNYVEAFSLIFSLRLGNLSPEEMIHIFKQVSKIEYEFQQYKKFTVVQGSKDEKK